MTYGADKGFTIVELMIAIAVLGLLLGLGIPSFQSTIQNNRMTSSINELVTSLNQARSEAVKQNLPVRICASDDGTSCGDNSVNWEDGWIVFVDRDDDGVIDDGDDCGENATDDCILSVQTALAGNLTLRGNDNTLAYFGSGASNNTDTITVCDSRGDDYAKAIIISSTGRPSIAHKETDGSDLTCPS